MPLYISAATATNYYQSKTKGGGLQLLKTLYKISDL